MTAMDVSASINEAVTALQNGEVIAYPTEAVFGVGCDPTNDQAVSRLLELKQRPANKGLIIIAANVSQLDSFIEPPTEAQWQQVLMTWPGPVTWLMPVKPTVSRLLTGEHSSLAVRVTDHPVAKRLCEQFGHPIVSTSANKSSMPPARSVSEVREQFGNEIRCIVDGDVDKQAQPSQIRDLLTGQVIRG